MAPGTGAARSTRRRCNKEARLKSVVHLKRKFLHSSDSQVPKYFIAQFTSKGILIREWEERDIIHNQVPTTANTNTNNNTNYDRVYLVISVNCKRVHPTRPDQTKLSQCKTVVHS